MIPNHRSILGFIACLSLAIPAISLPPLAATVHQFEGRHSHAPETTPDGTRLLAVNHAEGRLSVFVIDEGFHRYPILVDEILVGAGPVSVRARTDDEVWVVNEISDTVSVISLRGRRVVASLPAPDEPVKVFRLIQTTR